MDPDAARAELPTVEHEVVARRADVQKLVARRGREQLQIVGVRHDERVVGGDRPSVAVDPLEQREVDDPDELETPFRDGRARELEAQLTEHGVDSPPRARDEQQQVARGSAERVDHAELLGLREELRHRRVEPSVLLHSHPHESVGAELLGALGERVEAAAAHRALARHPDALHHFSLEGAELGRFEALAHVEELEAEARVGLVDAEPVHRLLPRHTPERGCTLAPHGRDRALHRLRDGGHHVVGVGEAHLHVVLHELELAIGARVLVAQASGDLEVPVEASDHQQLLEQLRALRQGVERTGLEPRRHHEVARSLRRGRDQHRRLDLDELLLGHRVPHGVVHHRPHAEVALHAVAPEVEIPVLEPERLVGLDALERDRRRLGRVEHFQPRRGNLDLPRCQLRVDGSLRTVTHDAVDPDHILGAQLVRVRPVGSVRVDDDLHDAGGVAHVEEHDAAVVTTTRHPAAHADLLVDVLGAQIAAPVRAHHRTNSLRSRSHPAI